MTAAVHGSILRRLAVIVVGVIALAGCQLDVTVDVIVEDDGTGTITVVAVADAGLIERVPSIADDLVLDDVIDAGWEVDGPNPTDDGGLMITLSHPFEGSDEATNLLRSLGPPFNSPVLGRNQTGDSATNTFKTNLGLPEGFASFADDDLIAAVGGDSPFADEFAEAGAEPGNSLFAVLRVSMPGEVIDSETNATVLEDGTLQWTMPASGIDEVSARTEQAPSEGSAWARPVAVAALIALIVWVAFMTMFIGYVAFARRRRSRRYRRRSLPLANRRQL